MSQENVEIVLGVYEAFTRRDNAAPYATYAPDIQMDFRHSGFDAPALYRGHDGVRAAFRDWLAPFREFEFRPGETKDCGDRVLVTVYEHGVGRASGATVHRTHYALWTLRGRTIVSLCVYLDHAEALQAAGAAEQAMPGNVDLVRSIFADWERGEYRSIGWAHPEIENEIVGGPSPGTWSGLAGMAEGWRDFLSAWEAVRFQADEYRELDGERVLVLTHASGHGRTSGLDLGKMPTRGANLFHIRDGRVTRHVAYLHRDLAFSDLGLTE